VPHEASTGCVLASSCALAPSVAGPPSTLGASPAAASEPGPSSSIVPLSIEHAIKIDPATDNPKTKPAGTPKRDPRMHQA